MNSRVASTIGIKSQRLAICIDGCCLIHIRAVLIRRRDRAVFFKLIAAIHQNASIRIRSIGCRHSGDRCKSPKGYFIWL